MEVVFLLLILACCSLRNSRSLLFWSSGILLSLVPQLSQQGGLCGGAVLFPCEISTNCKFDVHTGKVLCLDRRTDTHLNCDDLPSGCEYADIHCKFSCIGCNAHVPCKDMMAHFNFVENLCFYTSCLNLSLGTWEPRIMQVTV